MNAPTDFTALKSRQQTAWASGDYAVIGTTLQIVGEQLAEACDLRWDERVLDVAAGNGNATLAAARRGCRVTSTDYVAALLDRGAERAARRAPRGRVPGGRRRGAALRRRQLRRRALHLRRHVRARPAARRGRARPRLPPGRPHRPRQLDARGLHRPAVQGAGPPRAAACRRAAALALGRRGPPATSCSATAPPPSP